ncbi:MAG: CHASE2 domain-containing protein [Deltaproteobacteria bacterium]|nr:CHASE2 domain-containing protein [Deltaproteobacteria bacterium]
MIPMKSFIVKIAKHYAGIISIFIIVMGIFTYFVGIQFLDDIELQTIDLRFKIRGRISPGGEVVLAVIDEKSIAKEGKWIWPRSKMADLITKVSGAGAKVIGFDIGFLEADEKSVVQTIDKIQKDLKNLTSSNMAVTRYLDRLRIKSDHDQYLADAIRNSRAKVVLGYFFQMGSDVLGHFSEEDIRTHQKNTRYSAYKAIRYTSAEAQEIQLIEAAVPQSNIEAISSATDYSGFFNMFPDPDGVFRWIPGVIKFKDMLYAPLSLMLVSAFLDTPLSLNVAEYGIEDIQIGKLSIPADEFGRILINYRGEEKSFPHIPVTDILNGNISSDALQDKIVLVGATAVGIYDVRVTPFGTLFPGLEIHANVVDSVLSKDFIHQPGWAKIFDLLAIIITGTILGIVLPRSGVISGAVVVLSLLSGYVWLCQFLFSKGGWILNLVYPLAGIVFIYISITVYRYFTETKQKRFIKDAFSAYLAPAVVRQLIETPDKFKLGGEKKNITAFFSDVQGFTSISEKLSPEELVELLNEFLTEMTDIILNHEGTVDKFEGDAIIAFFGAPNDVQNHAEVACRASIEMQKRLVELRGKWRHDGRPELRMRIGLCTGPAVVGNMGSRNRMDYTMMGDTVNIAARLEGINKVYGIYALISDSTYRAAGDGIMTREIDSVNVVGKIEPVTIYQLLGYPQDIDDRTQQIVDHYTKGLDAYQKRDWNRAVESFKAALNIAPDDGPSQTMLSRCNDFKVNPPGEDWDGSYTMISK